MRFSVYAALSLLAVIATASVSHATVYDAATDLLANPTSNPNGVWTYGGYSAAGTTLLSTTGTFNPFADPGEQHADWAFGFNGWAVGAGIAVPAIEVNISGVPNSPCCGITPIDPGAIFAHPGPSNGPQDDVAILWTAPANGTVDISASFSQHHDNPQLGEVALNGVIVFAANATPGAGTPYGALSVPVLVGDTISFIVNNANGYGAGTTQLAGTVTLTPTPEPASVVLFGLGALGLLAVARRRRAA